MQVLLTLVAVGVELIMVPLPLLGLAALEAVVMEAMGTLPLWHKQEQQTLAAVVAAAALQVIAQAAQAAVV